MLVASVLGRKKLRVQCERQLRNKCASPSTPGFLVHGFVPAIADVWGLGGPGGPKKHSKKGGGQSPPLFGMVSGAAQTPKQRRFLAGPKIIY